MTSGFVEPWLPEAHHQKAQCLARVANRSGHGFTDTEAARHMYREFAAAELDEGHRLDEPPGADPEAVAEAVLLRFGRGALRCAAR